MCGCWNVICFVLLQNVWETEFQTHFNISGCPWIPPAVGNLLSYQMALSFIRHLSLFKGFLFLCQTWFCPSGPYRIILSLLLDYCLQYLRPISYLILSIFMGVTLLVPLDVLRAMSWFQIPTYPICSIRVHLSLAISLLVCSIQNWMLYLSQAIISYLIQITEDSSVFPKKQLQNCVKSVVSSIWRSGSFMGNWDLPPPALHSHLPGAFLPTFFLPTCAQPFSPRWELLAQGGLN